MTMKFLVEIDINHDVIMETTAKVSCDYEDEGKEKSEWLLKTTILQVSNEYHEERNSHCR